MRIGALVSVLALGLWLIAGATAVPRNPPPTPPADVAPPPAWLAARSGEKWLAYGGYCWRQSWKARCVDLYPPADRLPRVVLRAGEVVRFHLGFRPTRLTLYIGRRAIPLPASEAAAWRVSGKGGVADLSATATVEEGERTVRVDAAYHARIVIVRAARR